MLTIFFPGKKTKQNKEITALCKGALAQNRSSSALSYPRFRPSALCLHPAAAKDTLRLEKNSSLFHQLRAAGSGDGCTAPRAPASISAGRRKILKPAATYGWKAGEQDAWVKALGGGTCQQPCASLEPSPSSDRPSESRTLGAREGTGECAIQSVNTSSTGKEISFFGGGLAGLM